MSEDYGAYYGPNRGVPVGPLSPPDPGPSIQEMMDEIPDYQVGHWWQDAFDAMNGDKNFEADTMPIAEITDALARPLGDLWDLPKDAPGDALLQRTRDLLAEMDEIARKAILRRRGVEVR